MMIGGTMSNKAFTLERAACAIFGLPTYGVHMTAYEGSGRDMKIWVPRRAETKATWPGKLDNVSCVEKCRLKCSSWSGAWSGISRPRDMEKDETDIKRAS